MTASTRAEERRPRMTTMAAIRRRLRGIALALVVAGGAGAITLPPARAEAATYRVVDAETGEALAGAVVVVVWNQQRPLSHGQVVPSLVVERLADPAGRFRVMVERGLVAAQRDVIVYKPGYHPRQESTRMWWTPLFDGPEVGLTKIATPRDAKRYEHPHDFGVRVCAAREASTLRCVRPGQVPRLMQAMAIHQKVYHPAGWGFGPVAR